MSVIKEFKEFAVKGNVVDMGTGIVIGAAFTSIVNSLVKDIFTPLLALFTSDVNFSNWFIVVRKGTQGGPYQTLVQAQADNAITINIGNFIDAGLSFLIVAMALFFVVRLINKLRRPHKVTADPVKTKECPHCFSIISLLNLYLFNLFQKIRPKNKEATSNYNQANNRIRYFI